MRRRTLYASLARVRALPDFMQVWPGHGAGSACGKALGAVPASTVGYEKRFNWGLAAMTEDEFVRQVLDGQPEPPAYFAHMKRINKEGPALLRGFRRPERLPATRLRELLDGEQVVVDTRTAAAFAEAYVPGTINIPLNTSFSTWVGSLLPYDRDLYLIVSVEGRALDDAVRDLAMIGIDRPAGSSTRRRRSSKPRPPSCTMRCCRVASRCSTCATSRSGTPATSPAPVTSSSVRSRSG